MKCEKCGSLLGTNDEFCKICGATVSAQPVMPEQSVAQPVMPEQPVVQPVMPEQPVIQPVMPEQPVIQPVMPEQPVVQPVMPEQPVAQPVMAPEQPVAQPVMAPEQPVVQQQKSGGAVKFVILGIIIVIAIFGGLFIFYSMNNKKSANTNDVDESSIASNSTKSYKINFNGFTFEIPDNLVYEQKSNYILFGDEDDTWVVELAIGEGSFAKLKQNKSQLPTLMQSSGYTCAAPLEKSFGGVDYLTMEVKASGDNALFALAKLNAMYYVAVTALNKDNEYDYNILKNVSPIIKSAEVVSVTNNISSDIKFDVNAFSELAK